MAVGIAAVASAVLLTATPSAGAQGPSASAADSSICGQAKVDYVGATYSGSLMRSDGAKNITMRFDSTQYVWVQDPDGGSLWTWWLSDEGIQVNRLGGVYYLRTRVCDGFGDTAPSMVGGVQKLDGWGPYAVTLYRLP